MTGPWIALIIVLWATVLLIGFLVLGLLNRTSSVLDRLQSALERGELGGLASGRGLSPGSRVPTFSGRTPDGNWLSDADLRGQPTVMLFLDPDCGPCKALVTGLRDGSMALNGAQLVVVMHDTDEARSIDVGRSRMVVFQSDNSISMAFRTAVTPNAFALSAAGKIVDRRIPSSVEDLAELAREAVREEVRLGIG